MQKTKRITALILLVGMLAAFTACSQIDGAVDWFQSIREQILSLMPQSVDWDTLPSEPVPNSAESINKDVQVPPSRHYYARLTARQQHAYIALLRQMPDFPKRIEIPPMNGDSLAAVVEAYSYDNPAQFNLGESYTLITQGAKSYFQPEYRFDKENYAISQQKMQREIEKAVKTMPANGSDYEKELTVHNFLVNRIVYQNHALAYEATAYGALVLGKAACEGYSRAAKLLLEALGVETVLTTGNATNNAGKTEAHMWNTVKVDGAWYQLDVTWDDPGETNNDGWRYDYFNVTDKEISGTHKLNGFIPCTSTKANYFRKEGLYFENYNAAAKSAISAALGRNVKIGVYQLDLRFAGSAVLAEAQEKLTNSNNGEIYRMLKTASINAKEPIVTNEIRYYVNEELNTIRFLVGLA
ncbi:MAG: hypothetical protein LBJ12_07865 [Oscillospiraceae bacterium]|jgi:hypothetical protein|nr:hypothetical protein [Oscillospiraceae bacterium]